MGAFCSFTAPAMPCSLKCQSRQYNFPGQQLCLFKTGASNSLTVRRPYVFPEFSATVTTTRCKVTETLLAEARDKMYVSRPPEVATLLHVSYRQLSFLNLGFTRLGGRDQTPGSVIKIFLFMYTNTDLLARVSTNNYCCIALFHFFSLFLY